MASSTRDLPRMTSHLRLVRRLNRWFERAGIESGTVRAQLTIDLADSLDAAKQIRRLTDEMLACDPTTRRGAARALRHAGYIDALAFTELRAHVASLKRVWESKLLKRLAETTEGKKKPSKPRKRTAT